MKNHASYFSDDKITTEDFDFDNILLVDFDNILLDKKSYKNILVYDISYKTLISAKPLCIMFDKVDIVYDETRYLILLDPEKYGSVYNFDRYFMKKGYYICYFL